MWATKRNTTSIAKTKSSLVRTSSCDHASIIACSRRGRDCCCVLAAAMFLGLALLGGFLFRVSLVRVGFGCWVAALSHGFLHGRGVQLVDAATRCLDLSACAGGEALCFHCQRHVNLAAAQDLDRQARRLDDARFAQALHRDVG